MFLHKKKKNIDIAKKSYFKIGEKNHPEIEKFPEKKKHRCNTEQEYLSKHSAHF